MRREWKGRGGEGEKGRKCTFNQAFTDWTQLHPLLKKVEGKNSFYGSFLGVPLPPPPPHTSCPPARPSLCFCCYCSIPTLNPPRRSELLAPVPFASYPAVNDTVVISRRRRRKDGLKDSLYFSKPRRHVYGSALKRIGKKRGEGRKKKKNICYNI